MVVDAHTHAQTTAAAAAVTSYTSAYTNTPHAYTHSTHTSISAGMSLRLLARCIHATNLPFPPLLLPVGDGCGCCGCLEGEGGGDDAPWLPASMSPRMAVMSSSPARV